MPEFGVRERPLDERHVLLFDCPEGESLASMNTCTWHGYSECWPDNTPCVSVDSKRFRV